MASSRRSRRNHSSGRGRATAFLLLLGASVSGWLALSGHLFTFTNGSIFGLALTSAFLTAAMLMAVGAAATAFRGMASRERRAIVDARRAEASAPEAVKPKRRDRAA